MENEKNEQIATTVADTPWWLIAMMIIAVVLVMFLAALIDGLENNAALVGLVVVLAVGGVLAVVFMSMDKMNKATEQIIATRLQKEEKEAQFLGDLEREFQVLKIKRAQADLEKAGKEAAKSKGSSSGGVPEDDILGFEIVSDNTSNKPKTINNKPIIDPFQNT
jgi:ABC-type transport system involved in cytochrome bd biosynthesis fused ATPase/permease subunit